MGDQTLKTNNLNEIIRRQLKEISQKTNRDYVLRDDHAKVTRELTYAKEIDLEIKKWLEVRDQRRLELNIFNFKLEMGLGDLKLEVIEVANDFIDQIISLAPQTKENFPKRVCLILLILWRLWLLT